MMANNSPIAISDSDISSSVCYPESNSTEFSNPDVAALRLLSSNFEHLFQSPDFKFCADARISVGSALPPSPREVPVHRCVLSARSPFFREFFAKEKGAARFEVKALLRDLDVGFDSLVTVLGYVYSGRVGPLPKGVCVCVDEDCPHVGCRPAIDFMVEVLYASFVFQVTELVSLFQRHLLDILERVAKDDMLVILTVANLCSESCMRLVTKCIEIAVNSDLDVVTLEKTLPPDIVKQIIASRIDLGLDGPKSIFPDKHAKRIHRALDSDDVELVRMLLKEGQTTLDDAFALHYAIGHCDPKTTMELLDLGLADVNRRNLRGYTVLHISAMRKEPKIIASLLTKGARPSDLTSDGRNALQISKRLTRYADYYRSTEEGKPSPKDRLCVEILEQAERRDPLLGEASVSLAVAGDDVRSKLLYLENRVGLARLLFPVEAKVAMDIAHVDGTLEFTLGTSASIAPGSRRSKVDLNEAPFLIKEEHLSRMRALSKTVELGRRFFPRCSQVLDKIMDDESTDLASLGNETSEQLLQQERYQELQMVVQKAFCEDKEENKSAISSSSSTLEPTQKLNRR